MLRIILFCVFLFPLVVLSNNDKLVLIAGDNWCPVNCGENDKDKGFMIDVATEALAISGYEVQYVEMPWLRAIHQAREGKVHAIVGAFKDDAPDFYFPKVPILSMSPNTLFTLTDNTWVYNNQHSLNKVRLGVVQGYDYGHLLNAYIKSHRTSPNNYITQISGDNAVKRSLQLLTSKRIDVYVDAGPVVWFHAKRMGLNEQIKSVGSVSPLEPAYIAFSPKLTNSEQLSLALDLGVLRLQLDGRLAVIAKKYGLHEMHYR